MKFFFHSWEAFEASEATLKSELTSTYLCKKNFVEVFESLNFDPLIDLRIWFCSRNIDFALEAPAERQSFLCFHFMISRERAASQNKSRINLRPNPTRFFSSVHNEVKILVPFGCFLSSDTQLV